VARKVCLPPAFCRLLAWCILQPRIYRDHVLRSVTGLPVIYRELEKPEKQQCINMIDDVIFNSTKISGRKV
jgi:hypothetical protein